MSGPRILYVVNSMEGGGAQTPLPKILHALEKAGAQTRLVALTRRNGRANQRLQQAGIDAHVREGGEKDHLAALRWLKEQARAFGADAIYTSLTRATLLGQFAGAQLGIPVASWQHNAYLKPWNERLLRWRARSSALWIADSAEVARLTHERLGLAPKDLITWPIFFSDVGAPQAVPWRQGEQIRVGSLGRLHSNKGYDYLVEALAILKARGFAPPAPVKITIGGTGDEEGPLRAALASRGIENVELAGFVDDPARFLAHQHLYLQPSRREGFCIAAHEAMQAGLPVIVSDTGELPFTVNSEKMGRVVPVGNTQALAASLSELLSDPAQLYPMGQAAQSRVRERFSQASFDAIGAQIVRRLNQILSSR